MTQRQIKKKQQTAAAILILESDQIVAQILCFIISLLHL
jgi:hypothetical protein